jgi:two-component system, OmpR family, response regulator MprA
MSHSVLVVDDDPSIRDAVGRALRLDGYSVTLAGDGLGALREIEAASQDVVLLDIGLPELDGLAVCRRLRAGGRRTPPILLLTARDAVADRVEGLDAGADDYLVKPFALDELLARVRALIRRAEPADAEEPLRFADVVMDGERVEVRRGERIVELTRTEYNLLELFLRNPRRVLTRSTILTRVWGYDLGEATNSLDVYIGYLRRKLEAGGEPRLIHTVRGFGYVLKT